MSNSLKLVLVGVALLGVAYGASIGPTGKGKECTVQDRYFALSCAFQMRDFGSKVKELDMSDKEDLKEFRKSCNALENCNTNLCDGFTDDDVKQAFTVSRTYCGIINFVTGDFKKCTDKLDAKESKCYEDWDPFLDDEDLKDQKKAQEACKNFFGKDQCMKKEVTETCGEKEWEKLRDNIIKMDEEIMKQCNLKNMFS